VFISFPHLGQFGINFTRKKFTTVS
jgi:hypothetical protein